MKPDESKANKNAQIFIRTRSTYKYFNEKIIRKPISRRQASRGAVQQVGLDNAKPNGEVEQSSETRTPRRPTDRPLRSLALAREPSTLRPMAARARHQDRPHGTDPLPTPPTAARGSATSEPGHASRRDWHRAPAYHVPVVGSPAKCTLFSTPN